ncbi:unnamed protein product [Albugo candida]|uniref:Uncharacterized protein n=1 Tax=Albugo candida TaxID=65357 RepID=A0A024GAU6_9STRA|nr:unnamed protein product [Albugo candida]|eukprot:CCI43675.1 unnamed protein product [Albugo candida]
MMLFRTLHQYNLCIVSSVTYMASFYIFPGLAIFSVKYKTLLHESYVSLRIHLGMTSFDSARRSNFFSTMLVERFHRAIEQAIDKQSKFSIALHVSHLWLPYRLLIQITTEQFNCFPKGIRYFILQVLPIRFLRYFGISILRAKVLPYTPKSSLQEAIVVLLKV